MVFFQKTGVVYVINSKKGKDIKVISKAYGYIREKDNNTKIMKSRVLL